MTSFQQFWDVMAEEANISEEGKLFRAAGFALRYEGKGRSAWVKPVIDGWSIVINDEELNGHLVDDGGCWMVGAFSDDRNRLITLDTPAPRSLADALLIAEYLTNMLRAKGGAAVDPDNGEERVCADRAQLSAPDVVMMRRNSAVEHVPPRRPRRVRQ